MSTACRAAAVIRPASQEIVALPRAWSLTLVAGYACIAAAGLIAVYGLYPIIPQFL